MRAALTGGAYQARSVIASAQRCVNLYAEPLPQVQGEPAIFTYYPTPGLRLLGAPPTPGVARGLYRGSNDVLYYVCGSTLYSVDSTWAFTEIGTLLGSDTTPVSMKDNTNVLLVVDGTTYGYQLVMTTKQVTPDPDKQFSQISDAAFYGADRVDYIDTYFTFNKPGTPQFYTSASEYAADGSTPFDSLYFANKAASPDYLTTQAVINDNIWLIGEQTTEIWADAGASDFPFQKVSGAFVQHGCVAKYSLAQADEFLFWLSRDATGQAIVLQTVGYAVKRVSTFALEAEWAGYLKVTDAIGYSYQLAGHTYYVLTFPDADRTWVYDLATEQWHQWASLDLQGNGILKRHRSNCCAFAYGTIVVGDYETGALYALDPSVYTDNGQPIRRVRSWPHMVNNWQRTSYSRFTADIQVGAQAAGQSSAPPEASLRWSDTRGASWGNPILKTLGATGQYDTSVSWWRLGQARDRVFEVSWSEPVPTALQGAWVEVSPGTS